jgi:hypothetical protein
MRIDGPASLLLLALAAAPQVTHADPAAPPPSGSPLYNGTPLVAGDVSLAFGYADAAPGLDGAVLVGTGVVNVPLWAGWNEDLEIAEVIGDSRTDYGVFGHTYFKTPRYAVGFVAGATKANGSGYDGTVVTVGGETAVFLPTATLAGQFLYSWGSGDTPDSWSIGGEARWYMDPDTRLSGRLAWRGSDGDLLASAVAEHRFSGSMFTAFAAASYCSCTAWDIVLGTRLIFSPAAPTLQDHDYRVPFAVGRPVSG